MTPFQLAERCRERLVEPCECRVHCAKSAAEHAFAERRLARATGVLRGSEKWTPGPALSTLCNTAEQEIRALAEALEVEVTLEVVLPAEEGHDG